MTAGLPELHPGLTQTIIGLAEAELAASAALRAEINAELGHECDNDVLLHAGTALSLLKTILESHETSHQRGYDLCKQFVDLLWADCSPFAANGLEAGHESDDTLGDGHRVGNVVQHGAVGVSELIRGRHHSLLAVARAGTRYVAGALFLAALWQLQRKAGLRRAAVPCPRPSDAAPGGAR